MSKKRMDVVNETLPKGQAGAIGEIGKEPIEKVRENDIGAQRLEAFMNEPVKIMVHPSTEEGSLEIITPSVNGVNQPIIRGQEITIKRKFVEALARNRTTRYIQQTPDPTKPENIQMKEITAVSCPFSVLEDKNPDGYEWLKNIQEQP